MKRLLLTAGGSPGQEGIYRLLKDKYDLYFADLQIRKISDVIPEKKKLEVPAVESENYLDKLIYLCETLEIDLLVPGIDEELNILHQAVERLGATKLFLPKSIFVETMLSKFRMAKTLSEAGIRAPKTLLFGNGPINIASRVVMKPEVGRGSRNVFVLTGADKAESLFEAIGNQCSSWVVQEFIAGEEYTVQVIAGPDSKLAGVVPIRVSEKRGSTISAETESDKGIIEYCEMIHERLDPQGSYNVQLIKAQSGDICAFEINPRISTTMLMAIAAGFDPFSLFLSGVDSIQQRTNVPKILLHRHWSNRIEVLS